MAVSRLRHSSSAALQISSFLHDRRDARFACFSLSRLHSSAYFSRMLRKRIAASVRNALLDGCAGSARIFSISSRSVGSSSCRAFISWLSAMRSIVHQYGTWHDSVMVRTPRRHGSTRFERFHLGRPWCEALLLRDGRKLIMRPIEPEDAETLRRSFGELTPEEIRFRFLHPLTELSAEYALRLARIDRRKAFALVLVEALPPEQARIGAVARVVIDEGGRDAEFAIIVGRELGNFGLGTYLLARIVEWSRKKGLDTLYGDVMIENNRMLRLARKLGFAFRMNAGDPQIVRIVRPLKAG